MIFDVLPLGPRDELMKRQSRIGMRERQPLVLLLLLLVNHDDDDDDGFSKRTMMARLNSFVARDASPQ